MMEVTAEDDICILSNVDDIDGSVDVSSRCLIQDFVISRSSIQDGNNPALHALQNAYTDLKKRYNDLALKNQQMSRALRNVDSIKTPRQDMSSYNDLQEGMSYNAQGAAAMAESPGSPDADQGAQQGYIKYLEREQMNAKVQIMKLESLRSSFEQNCSSMQVKLKESIKEVDRKDQDLRIITERNEALREENQSLKKERDGLLKQIGEYQERLRATIMQLQQVRTNQSGGDLQKKCVDLEQECTKLQANESASKFEIKRKDEALINLQQKYKLLEQKYLTVQSDYEKLRVGDMSLMASTPAADELVHLKQVITGLKQTVLQQRDFLSSLGANASMIGIKSSPKDIIPLGRRVMITTDHALSQPHMNDFAAKKDNSISSSWECVGNSPDILGKVSRSRLAEDSSWKEQVLKVSLPDARHMNSPESNTHSQNTMRMPRPKSEQLFSKTEILQRKPSVDHHDRSRTNVLAIRDIGQINNVSNFAESRNRPHDINMCHSQVIQDEADENILASVYDNARGNLNTHYNRRDSPEVPQPLGHYYQNNNLSASHVAPAGLIVCPQVAPPGPNMYAREQSKSSVRVQSTGSANEQSTGNPREQFTSPGQNGCNVTTGSNPRENSAPDIARTMSNRICPVCSKEFSHLTMEDFQSHVFECFDDSNPLETLRAENQNERICPMCNALYPEAVDQEEFERHVQGHFTEDNAGGFEILQP